MWRRGNCREERKKNDIKINNLELPEENRGGELGEFEDFICFWFRNHSERNDQKQGDEKHHF